MMKQQFYICRSFNLISQIFAEALLLHLQQW